MDFDFADEQYMLRDSGRDFLQKDCPPAEIRRIWEDSTGRSPQRWKKLGEMGVLGLTLPETYGGAGMDEIDLVLVLEEAGRNLLPEPLLEHTAVGGPLLAKAGTDAQKSEWLTKAAHGEATISVGLAGAPYVPDANAAVVILEENGELHPAPPHPPTPTPPKPAA